jgi:ankyrin repeat protein
MLLNVYLVLVQIYLRDEDGHSPFFVASWKGECDVVECLLSSGADFNLCDVDEYPPLISALSSGHYDIVRLLTAHEAYVNIEKKK